jgi:hypothetical protein
VVNSITPIIRKIIDEQKKLIPKYEQKSFIEEEIYIIVVIQTTTLKQH